MMKLIYYEIKKLFGQRLFLPLLSVLLIASCFFTYSAIPEDEAREERELSSFLALYEEKTEEIETYISDLNKLIRNYDPTSGETIPTTVYSENDLLLFSHLREVQRAQSKYDARVQEALAISRGRLREYEYLGYSEKSFEVTYQQNVVASYEKLTALSFPMENVIGFDDFFDDSGFCALLLAAILVCGIYLVIPEKSGGMLLILRAGKNGRGKTYFAKAVTGLCMTAALTVLFSGASLLVILGKKGLAGGPLPLQMIDSMMLSPFLLTIWQGVLLTVLFRVLSACCFFCLIFALACLFRDYLAPFAAGGAFIALNYAAGTYSFLNDYSFFKNLNFFWTLDGTKALKAYRGVRLFGRCASLLPTIAVTYSVLGVAGIIGGLFAFLYSKHREKKSLRLPAWVKKIRLPERKRHFSTHLARYELRKTATPLALVLVGALAAGSLILCEDKLHPIRSYDDTLYTEYMTEFRGEWSEEKDATLNDMLMELVAISAQKDEMELRYQRGEITPTEYGTYMSAYLDAQNRIPTLSKLVTHSAYLRTYHEAGVPVAFLDDTGWNLLASVNLSPLLLGILLLLFSDGFSGEYRSGFITIARASKNGKARLLLTKLALAFVLSLLLAAFFESVQFATVNRFSGLPGGSYPVISMEQFAEAGSASVQGYFLGREVRNLFLYGLFGAATVLLSRLTKKIVPTLLVSAAVVFAPVVLSYFGVTFLDAVSVISLFAR